MRLIPIMVILVGLAGCGSISAPVAVISDKGDLLRGSTTASLSGGSFEVSGRYDGKLISCGGTYNALDSSKVIKIPTTCSNGQNGLVTAVRDGTGVNGSGNVAFSNGSKARFVFGDAASRYGSSSTSTSVATNIAPTRMSATPSSVQSLPDVKWVVAQSEPYMICGSNTAARMAVTLPNESPENIATAANLQCNAQRQRYNNAVRPKLPADLFSDISERTENNFRKIAISSVLNTRERLRIESMRERSTPQVPRANSSIREI